MSRWTHMAFALLLFALAGAWSGCGGDEPPCEPGTEDCDCLEALTCAQADLYCDGLLCRMPACTLGAEGCACLQDGACGLDGEGRRLFCEAGYCVSEACPAGATGCGCLADGRCAGEGVCRQTETGLFCDDPECLAGEEGCGCLPDRTCIAATDGRTLVCDDGICAQADCAPGTPGCACRADFGCDQGTACNAQGRCDAPTCSRGSIGCACELDGSCRGDGLVCVDGRCAEPGCPAGAPGCGCRPDYTCDPPGSGTPTLVCEVGRCVELDCLQGDVGCGCRGDERCNSDEAVCADGICVPIACRPGEVDCICATGEACDDGLLCRNGLVCTDARGFAGGACLPNGSCRRGNRCDQGTCVACSVGAMGCTCYENGTCRTGMLCRGEICVDENELVASIPGEPQCWTPCSTTSEKLVCEADGLARGCLEGQTCLDGSCVNPGEQPPTCTIQSDCPTWQTCFSGRCYSTCEQSSDCGGTQVCHLRVCRAPCDRPEDCGANQVCELLDGAAGVCMPQPRDSALPEDPGALGVTLDAEQLIFTPEVTRLSFQVFNPGDMPVTLRVQKLEHRTFDDDAGAQSVRSRGDDADCAETGACPLFWLRIGETGDAARSQRWEQVLAPGASTQVVVAAADESDFLRWQGTIEVGAVGGSRETVDLVWNDSPEGYWYGRIVYFGNFEDENLLRWRDGEVAAEEVPNALVNAWDTFGRGRTSWTELRAAIQSVRSASWRQPLVQARCTDATDSPDAACFPFDNADGVAVLSSNLASYAVPSGELEIPLAFWLDAEGSSSACPPGAFACMGGVVDSTTATHFPASPALVVGLGADPATCPVPSQEGCLTPLSTLGFEAAIGGRRGGQSPTCGGDSRYARVSMPWLTFPFLAHSGVQVIEGSARRFECLDEGFPLADDPARNASLARSTPLRTGRVFEREVELVSGWMLGQDTIIALIRESQSAIVPGGPPQQTYGLATFRRQDSPADMERPEPVSQEDTRPAPSPTEGLTCSAGLLSRYGAPSPNQRAAFAEHMSRAVLDGVRSEAEPALLSSEYSVHYVCGETGLFDGGPGNVTPPGEMIACSDACESAQTGVCLDGGPGSAGSSCAPHTDCSDCGPRYSGDADERIACPEGSDVRFFAIRHAEFGQADLAAHPCQLDGSCEQTLDAWLATSRYGVRDEIPWRCADVKRTDGPPEARDRCDDDRRDLRWGRVFLAPNQGMLVAPPLREAIAEAFRYRSFFAEQSGALVGFAPRPCTGSAVEDGYCYDVARIDDLRERLDCGLVLYTKYADDLRPEVREALGQSLRNAFGGREFRIPRQAVRFEPGFERLYAELMLLLADEAWARALGSRFDLLDELSEPFEGSAFEAGGPDFGGIAGSEMNNLYRAIQFQDLVLERFLSMAPVLLQDLASGDRVLLTQDSLDVWFSRVSRAATGKARVQARLARSWKDLGRADIAERVVERAFLATHLEGVVVQQVLQELQEALAPQERAQVARAIEDTQRAFRIAMTEIQEVVGEVRSGVNAYGFPDDYLPFPAVRPGETSAVRLSLDRARERIEIARRAEVRAIEERQSLRLDGANFSSELSRLRQEYDRRLGEICGTFTALDQGVLRTFPATRSYASLDASLLSLGDPCGRVENGAIYEALLDLEQAGDEMERQLVRLERHVELLDLELGNISRQCGITTSLSDYLYESDGEIGTLQDSISGTNLVTSNLKRYTSFLLGAKDFIKCEVGLSTDCPMGVAALSIYLVGGLVTTITQSVLEAQIGKKQNEVGALQREIVRNEALMGCEPFLVDGAARVTQLELERKLIELDVLRQQRFVALVAQRMESLANEVQRLEAEAEEARAQQIDVAAAIADPNRRLYANSAMFNAEFTYRSALREMWRAIRVFEYATSQSWGPAADLNLVRMVRYGDPSLEDLYFELEDAWVRFRESFGDPELRLSIVSLRDDILRIPRADDRGRPLTYMERVRLFREALLDPERRGGTGELLFAFNTRRGQVSPLTRNHRLAWVEAEKIGTDTGDATGRIYLRQAGTGTMLALDGRDRYLAMPERTAVINTFFNGQRFFDPAVYRSERFTDRPFLNSRWELVLEQQREEVNRDIRFGSLTDVRLYLYYTDFVDPSAQ